MRMTTEDNEWFKAWFDSPYYPILYRHRDLEEAGFFIENLVAYLDLPAGAAVLDLACGRGRHSVHLHHLGFRVTGIDLSPESIAAAREFAEDGLEFQVADMRSFALDTSFNAIVNLFTSFGYFAHVDENLKVLQGVKAHLKEEGQFVLDYFNGECVKAQLQAHVETTIDGIHFSIEKKIEEGKIIKDIEVKDGVEVHRFQERVQLFTAAELTALVDQSGMQVEAMFGNYSLDVYNAHSSPRLIVHCTL
jgi:SAM-dependent methyltransferase